jgi:hypothetical protein
MSGFLDSPAPVLALRKEGSSDVSLEHSPSPVSYDYTTSSPELEQLQILAPGNLTSGSDDPDVDTVAETNLPVVRLMAYITGNYLHLA